MEIRKTRKKRGEYKPFNVVGAISAVIFAGAVLLGGNTLFSVAEIRADYEISTDYYFLCAQEKQREIEQKYVGKNILFLSEEELAKEYENSGTLTVTSVTKQYPNVLLVKVSERPELFAVESGGVYYMMDGNGSCLRTSETNENVADGQPNFLISGLKGTPSGDFSGDKNFSAAMTICKAMNEATGGIRSSLSSMKYVQPTADPADSEFIVSSKEGVKIRIFDPTRETAKKISGAMESYLSLSPQAKLSGEIYALDGTDGQVKIYYSR